MSAFVVHPNHLRFLVQAAIDFRVMQGNPEEVLQMLFEENLASVQYRYPDCVEDPDAVPGAFGEYHLPLFFHRVVEEPAPLVVLKAIQCYQYQTCEHPTAAASEAWRWVERLKNVAISYLPGYSDAAGWDFRRA